MKSTIFKFILLIFILSMTSCGYMMENKATNGDDLPKNCLHINSGEISCFTTIRSIADDLSSYDDRNVVLSGYLAIDGGILSLYSDENSYIHQIIDENVIVIRAPPDVQKNLFDKYGYQYLRISGLFKANEESPASRYGIGTLSGEIRAYPLPKRDSLEEREGWKGIRIDVHDLPDAKTEISK